MSSKHPHRPNILWRTFVVAGLGTAGAVTVSDEAWEQFKNVAGDAIPREAFRSLLVSTAALHAAESTLAYGSARRAGLDRPGRWARATLLWGFPVLLRLRKAKRVELAD